jgi:hypothetical protein
MSLLVPNVVVFEILTFFNGKFVKIKVLEQNIQLVFFTFLGFK